MCRVRFLDGPPYANVAKLVRHMTFNHGIVGSSPVIRTICVDLTEYSGENPPGQDNHLCRQRSKSCLRNPHLISRYDVIGSIPALQAGCAGSSPVICSMGMSPPCLVKDVRDWVVRSTSTAT